MVKVQDNYENSIRAYWEYAGDVNTSMTKPYIQLNLDLTSQSPTRPQVLGQYPQDEENPNIPTEGEFFSLWDFIGKSIRFYPGALTPPPPPPPRETMPGPNAQQQVRDRQVLDDFINGKPSVS